MKFKFRLERVLDFVQLKETTKKMEVASVAKELTQLQMKKRNLEEGLRTLLEDTAAKLQKGQEWIPYQVGQIDLNRTGILKTESAIVKVSEVLEEKKFELGKIAMRRKALENLKEKRLKDFRTDEIRREQKKSDELFRFSSVKGSSN